MTVLRLYILQQIILALVLVSQITIAQSQTEVSREKDGDGNSERALSSASHAGGEWAARILNDDEEDWSEQDSYNYEWDDN